MGYLTDCVGDARFEHLSEAAGLCDAHIEGVADRADGEQSLPFRLTDVLHKGLATRFNIGNLVSQQNPVQVFASVFWGSFKVGDSSVRRSVDQFVNCE